MTDIEVSVETDKTTNTMTGKITDNQIERDNHQTGAGINSITTTDTAVATAETNPGQQTDIIPANGTSTIRDKIANRENDKTETTQGIDTTAERDQVIGEPRETQATQTNTDKDHKTDIGVETTAIDQCHHLQKIQ